MLGFDYSKEYRATIFNMSTEIDIVNLALARLGIDPIASLEEPTKAARTSKVTYPIARDAALADHEWKFARTSATLALLTETSPGYEYTYRYPANCVKAIKIDDGVNAADLAYDLATESYVPTSSIKFETGVDSTLNFKTILTDQPEAKLIYTARVTNPTVFDPLFIDAMAWRMASDLAVSLLGNFQLQSNYMNVYRSLFSNAKAQGESEADRRIDNTSSFTAAR